MIAVDTDFKPPLLLRHPHLQTTLQTLLGRGEPDGRLERLGTPDQDFVEVLWLGQGAGPVVVLLPGLGGSAWSPYATGMAKSLVSAGYRVAILHARGCGTEVNRLPKAYHSGQTEDLAHFLACLKCRLGSTPVFAVGFSLGGNVLLKYLAETRSDALVDRAVAVSPPLDLAACARRLTQGTSQFYQRYLLSGLHALLRAKRLRIDLDEHLDLSDGVIRTLDTIEAYDDRITAPLHGFRDKEDYYTQSSSGPRLPEIETPTLIVSALDDPFLDSAQYRRLPPLPASVDFKLTRFGGHVGFIDGIGRTGEPISWLEPLTCRYLSRPQD